PGPGPRSRRGRLDQPCPAAARAGRRQAPVTAAADRNVVVTGGAGGLGRAFALAFAESGAQVVAADIDIAGARQTAKLITESGGRALAAQVDVTDPASVGRLAQTAADGLGKVDVLVNNAAIYA